MSSDFILEETKYGFRWGPLEVMRLLSDDKLGVVISVMTDNQEMEIRSSPKGKAFEMQIHERRTPPCEPGVIIGK